MKRVSSLLIAFLMVFIIAACNNPVEDQPGDEEYNEELYEIYQLGVDAGAVNQTYEEWLEGIEGTDGEDGREIILTVSDTHIQWQYDGEDEWHNLISLDALVGPQGEDGQDGLSAYEIYLENNTDYQGDETQWLDDLVNGKLGDGASDDTQNTIQLKLNGGEIEGEPEITTVIGYDLVLPTPEKTGYSFEGWYKDTLLEFPFEATEMPSQPLSIYAKWSAETYTLTFDSNGGSAVQPISQEYGKDIDEPDAPTKTDYFFVGWYEDQNLNETFDFSSMPAGDVTLYAKWTNSVLDHIDEAKDELTLPIEDETVKMDIHLPTTLEGYSTVAIAWNSSHPETIATDGTVTRPAMDEDDETVTLTATLSYNDESMVKQFVVTVPKNVQTQHFTDFQALYEINPLGDPVSIKGVVTSEFDGGAFIWDGQAHMAIYDTPSLDIQDSVTPGDEIRYTGVYGKYQSLYQVKDRANLEILTSGNTYPTSAAPVTIADLYSDYDPVGNIDDLEVHGRHFTIQGEITRKGAYNNLYVESTTSAAEVEIYYQSLPDSLTALENHLGEIVELEVVYYLLNTDGTIRVLYQNDGSDITPATDQGKIDADIAALENTWTDGDDITLPTSGQYGTQFTNWTSSDTSLIADDGSFVSAPSSITTVFMSSTATLQTLSEPAMFTVSVLGTPTSINTVLNANVNNMVHTSGVVYAQFEGGYHITDGSNAVAVYTGEDIADQSVTMGDEVEVFGQLNQYNSLYQITDLGKEEILSSGNATTMSVDTSYTIGDIAALDSTVTNMHGRAFEVTGVLDIRGIYNNVWIDDPNTSDSVVVYHRSPEDSIQALEDKDGDTVTITVFYHMDDGNTLNVLYQDGASGIIPGSDQGKLDADIAALEDMWTDGDDLTLPTSGTYGTTFSNWTSSDTGLVDDNGTFVSAPSSITTLTMTGTATLGSLTQSASFDVTVLGTPTDINTALYSSVDDLVHTSGIVYAQFDGGYYIHDGTTPIAVYTDEAISDQSVTIGDETEVYGRLNKYKSLYQVSDVMKEEILSTGNTPTMTIDTTYSIADITALDSTVRMVHGQAFEVTGVLDIRGAYNNVWIDDPGSSESLAVYYRSPSDSITALEDHVGDNVTLTIYYHMDDAGDVNVIYQDGASGLSVNGSQTAFDADIEALEDQWTAGSNITIPTTGDNGTQFTNWTSSDTGLISDNGDYGGAPATVTGVTMTGTATLQNLTATVTFEVAVLGSTPMSIDTALNSADGDPVHTEGIVYAQFNGGYFIYDGSDTMGVYTAEDIVNQSINIGDEVELSGWLRSYHTLYEVGDVGMVIVHSEDNTLMPPVDTTQSIADLVAKDSSDRNLHGQRFEVTGTIDFRGPYTNAYLDDPQTGASIIVYYESPSSSIDALEMNITETVTLTVIYFADRPDGLFVIYQNGMGGITVQ